MIYKNEISELKKDFETNIGQKIVVKGSLGRNRLFEKEGVISEASTNLFVINFDEKNKKASYQYTHVLTKDIEVELFDGMNYVPIIPGNVEEQV